MLENKMNVSISEILEVHKSGSQSILNQPSILFHKHKINPQNKVFIILKHMQACYSSLSRSSSLAVVAS